MRFSQLLALAAVSAAAATTVSAQSRTTTIYRSDDAHEGRRAALGVSTTTTGTLRDTLGIMITSITRGSPAEKAGLEEGNRLAAINGVSLRANAVDFEDNEMSGALSRRLTRELAKVKAGDEVELRVYREGRTQAMRIRTVDSDSLFRRGTTITRRTREEMDNRPALGFGIGSSGSRRDTLGVLVMSVADSTPAARAGLEEGNRIAAINDVNLRVAREDAGDRSLGSIRANRLQREISQLKVGDNVTLRVYSSGQYRDVSMKVARVGDLPRSSGYSFFGEGLGMMPAMAPMPMMPSMPRTPRTPMAPSPPMRELLEDLHIEGTPELRRNLENLRGDLLRLRPQLQRGLQELRPELERGLLQLRPEIERLRINTPRVRMVNISV